jgi:hypothetical protein
MSRVALVESIMKAHTAFLILNTFVLTAVGSTLL